MNIKYCAVLQPSVSGSWVVRIYYPVYATRPNFTTEGVESLLFYEYLNDLKDKEEL